MTRRWPCIVVAMLCCLLAIVSVMTLPMPAWSADAVAEYQQGKARVSTYFFALYTEFGDRIQVGEMLLKCGYKKEGDELNARTRGLGEKKLEALIDKDMKDGTLQSMTALTIAHEGASSTLCANDHETRGYP